MRAVVQRVKSASVEVDGKIVSQIGTGLLCLIGLREGDTDKDVEYIARKILNMRLWPSDKRAWEQSVMVTEAEVLCVSQFTLYGRLQGNKPDFSKAMKPQEARKMYNSLIQRLKKDYIEGRISDGVFGAMMDVQLVNDGPVTLVIDSTRPAVTDGTASSSFEDV